MKIDDVRQMMAWGILINYGILIIWFIVFIFGHDQLRELHGRWFRLSSEQFEFVHYLGMAVYKLGIMLFFLTPYLGFRITQRRKQ